MVHFSSASVNLCPSVSLPRTHHANMIEYAACDDEGFVERSLSIDAIEAHRRVLNRSIKDPIHDYI